MSKLMKIIFKDGYSVMKQRFTYQGGYNVMTAEYGNQKTLTRLKKLKDVVKDEILVCFVMFRSFGAIFLCGTVTAMTYLDMLHLYLLGWGHTSARSMSFATHVIYDGRC
jgi:hypothetical protein